MIGIKCDNDNGTINWRNRAKIAVLVNLMCNGTKRALLAQVKDNPRFAKLVGAEWDRVKARVAKGFASPRVQALAMKTRKRNARAKRSPNIPGEAALPGERKA